MSTPAPAADNSSISSKEISSSFRASGTMRGRRCTPRRRRCRSRTRRLQRCGQRHGGGIGAAPSQRRDLLRPRVDALEAGDDHHLALGDGLPHPAAGDLRDLRRSVLGVGEDARLAAGEAHRPDPACLDRHGGQGHRDPLPGGEQHVEFTGGWHRTDGGRQFQQLVGGLPHGRHDHHHVVAVFAGGDDAIGHRRDPLGVGDGGAAVFLDDEGHARWVLSREGTKDTPAWDVSDRPLACRPMSDRRERQKQARAAAKEAERKAAARRELRRRVTVGLGLGAAVAVVLLLLGPSRLGEDLSREPRGFPQPAHCL
jgi:hypothetical protein